MIYDSENSVPSVWGVDDVILGTYVVKQVFTGGGMGLVYQVHHREWGVDLAVKSPRPEYFQRAAQQENFERECETWINLGLHPHIVSCYYVRRLGGIPRIFAEFVEGGSLAESIRGRQLYAGGEPKALRRILDVAIQVAWGLHCAHEQGLVHQDVKPANVLLAHDGTVKVTDFGLAKARAESGEVRSPDGRSILVSSGGMTPAYCSPEQFAGQPVTRKTDVWSWGLSVLEMFTGEVFWQTGIAANQALDAYLQSGSHRHGFPKMPDAIARMLRECFRLNPADRTGDLLTLASRIVRIHAELFAGPYQRPQPSEITNVADGLNNRAISLLHIGWNDPARRRKAEALFDEALRAKRHHPEATFNRGLMLWRLGKVSDEVLLTQLRETAQSEDSAISPLRFQAQIHAERGDAESACAAWEKLGQSATRMNDVAEAKDALAATQKARESWPRCERVLSGHDGSVRAVCFTPDGREVLSGSEDKTLRLWSIANGECTRVFIGHEGGVAAVAIGESGDRAVSGASDCTVRVWNLSTGKCLHVLHGHTKGITAVCFASDGSHVVSASEDKTLRLWNISTGKCVRVFEGHEGSVRFVCMLPGGRSAFSCSYDGTLRFWKLSTGEIEHGYKCWAACGCITRDGRIAACGNFEGKVWLWDAATSTTLANLEGHTRGVESIAAVDDARWFVSGGEDNTIRLWDATTGRCRRTFIGHSAPVVSLAVSREAAIVASAGSWDKTIRLWRLGRFGQKAPWAIVFPRQAAAVADESAQFAESLNAAKSALESGDMTMVAANLAKARRCQSFARNPELLELNHRAGAHGRIAGLRAAWLAHRCEGHSSSVTSVSCSADSALALSGSVDYTARLWSIKTGRCVLALPRHKETLKAVCLTPDAQFAVLACRDGSIGFWNGRGECLQTVSAHEVGPMAVDVSSDSRLCLSGGSEKQLKVWAVPSGQLEHTLRLDESSGSVAWSPTERIAVAGLWDSTILIWNLKTGTTRRLAGHEKRVRSVAVSPDGRRILSTSDDATLRLWDLASGSCLSALKGHTAEIATACFHRDSRFGFSGGHDKTIRLWNLETGECLRTFESHTHVIESLRVTADGRWLVTGGWDNSVLIWELDWDYAFL